MICGTRFKTNKPKQKANLIPQLLPVLGIKLASPWTEATYFKSCCCDFSGFFSIIDLPKSFSASFECHVTV